MRDLHAARGQAGANEVCNFLFSAISLQEQIAIRRKVGVQR